MTGRRPVYFKQLAWSIQRVASSKIRSLCLSQAGKPRQPVSTSGRHLTNLLILSYSIQLLQYVHVLMHLFRFFFKNACCFSLLKFRNFFKTISSYISVERKTIFSRELEVFASLLVHHKHFRHLKLYIKMHLVHSTIQYQEIQLI